MRSVVDLRKFVGREIFIRLVDERKGHWGHINFDDFKFYAERPKFDKELDAEKPAKQNEVPPPDLVKFAGLSPEQAAKEMTLPRGFKATLFAGEPDVKQPIAFAIDEPARGCLAVDQSGASGQRCLQVQSPPLLVYPHRFACVQHADAQW